MKQENASNDNTVTESELRAAGASATYIAYYLQAQEMGINTASTRHAEKVVNRGVEYSGGGFHDSLWDASPRFPHNSDNPYGADTQNHDILREAGVYDAMIPA
jgi:hypothetical protein